MLIKVKKREVEYKVSFYRRFGEVLYTDKVWEPSSSVCKLATELTDGKLKARDKQGISTVELKSGESFKVIDTIQNNLTEFLNEARISCRLSMSEIDSRLVSPVGMSIENVLDTYLKLANANKLGLSLYLLYDYNNFNIHLTNFLKVVDKIKGIDSRLSFVTLGGISYVSERYLGKISDELESRGIKLYLEVGRGLFSSACSIQMDIVRSYYIGKTFYIHLDTSVYHAYMDKYLIGKGMSFWYNKRNGGMNFFCKNPKGEHNPIKVVLCGNTLDTTDIFDVVYVSDYYREDLESATKIISSDISGYETTYTLNVGKPAYKIVIE